MVTTGLMVKLEAKAGREDDLASFLVDALPLVQEEPETVAWLVLHHLLIVNILFYILGVAGRPDFQTGIQVAAGQGWPLGVFINGHNFRRITELLLQQNFGYSHIHLRARPGILRQPDGRLVPCFFRRGSRFFCCWLGRFLRWLSRLLCCRFRRFLRRGSRLFCCRFRRGCCLLPPTTSGQQQDHQG